MAIITTSQSRMGAYVLFNKDGSISITTDKMDEVMIVKSKDGVLTTEMQKKKTSDKQLEKECLMDKKGA